MRVYLSSTHYKSCPECGDGEVEYKKYYFTKVHKKPEIAKEIIQRSYSGMSIDNPPLLKKFSAKYKPFKFFVDNLATDEVVYDEKEAKEEWKLYKKGLMKMGDHYLRFYGNKKTWSEYKKRELYIIDEINIERRYNKSLLEKMKGER